MKGKVHIKGIMTIFFSKSLCVFWISFQLYKQITNQLDLPTVCNQFASVRFYPGIVDLSLTAASKRDPQNLALHFYRNNEPPEDVQGMHAFSARCVMADLYSAMVLSNGL